MVLLVFLEKHLIRNGPILGAQPRPQEPAYNKPAFTTPGGGAPCIHGAIHPVRMTGHFRSIRGMSLKGVGAALLPAWQNEIENGKA